MTSTWTLTYRRDPAHRRGPASIRAGGLVYLLVLVPWPGVSRASEAAGPLWDAQAASQEVIYFEQRQMDGPDAYTVVQRAGSLDVELDDGTIWTLDPETLEDPDGNRYYVVGDSFQESELDPVIHQVQVVRYSPHTITDAEAVDEYLAVHPDATEQELREFEQACASAAAVPTIPRSIDDTVQQWLDTADSGDSMEVRVSFVDDPALALPQVDNELLETEPAAWLAGMEDRLLTIEQRKTDLYAVQEAFAAEYVHLGATLRHRHWVVNYVTLEVSPEALEEMIDDQRVQRVSHVPDYEPAQTYYHAGVDIREATQNWQYLDAGYNGQHGSGRSERGEIYALVVDTYIDVDHPAWKDDAPPRTYNRLISSYYYNNAIDDWVEGSNMSSNSTDTHGNRVAAAMLADLTEGQDTNITDPIDQAERTGMSTKTAFSFLEFEDSDGYEGFVGMAMELNVDLINFSLGDPNDLCPTNQQDGGDLQAINSAMLDGIFVVQAAGNNGNSTGSPPPCNVNSPGGASGDFVVGAYDHNATSDLNDAPIWSNPPDGSSRGGDAYGRPLIKIATPGGRELDSSPGCAFYPWLDRCVWPVYDDAYTYYGGSSTSRAAPVATGAAANLKDHLLSTLPAPWRQSVGLMFAHMLLMGDGKVESGTQVAATPIDELWGVGRLRMRLFNEDGMDYPWHRGWDVWVEDYHETHVIPVNPNIGGGNDVVPAAAEWFRAALWWHEPNMSDDDPYITTSAVSLKICDSTGTCHTCSSTAPQSQRLWLGSDIGGETWEIRVVGLNIPASIDPNFYYGETKRRMFLAYYWEDRARDDPDGPAPGDDIY